MNNLTTRVPNYTQIYFHYGTVTFACQGSGLACTRTVDIFRTLTYMQKHFCHQIKPGIGMNKYSKSILPTYTYWYRDL